MNNEVKHEKIIEIKDINKYYSVGSEKLHALKDVNLEVKEGEFLAILGPSGSGKSTLMNVIGCMDKPDSGSYRLDDCQIEQASEKELTRIRNEKIGFIFQKYHLIQTYNVMQNITMPLLVRGMTQKEAEEASLETIRMLGAGRTYAPQAKRTVRWPAAENGLCQSTGRGTSHTAGRRTHRRTGSDQWKRSAEAVSQTA